MQSHVARTRKTSKIYKFLQVLRLL